MAQQSGALANELTRKAMRSWFRSILLKGVMSVVIVNFANVLLLRTNHPLVVSAFLATIIVLGTLYLFGQAFDYLRFNVAQYVLYGSEWEEATGCVRRVYVGPVPIGFFGVMTSDKDDWLLARRVFPKRNALLMPAELAENNLVVAARGRRHVYSIPDGSTPVVAKRIHPKVVARAYRNAVIDPRLPDK